MSNGHSKHSEKFVRDFLIFYNASLVFFAVGVVTTLGIGWYGTIAVPTWTPPEELIAVIWGVLFVTTVLSLSRYADAARQKGVDVRNGVLMYMSNALLILLWNYLFFGAHQLALAVWAAVAVGLSVLALIWKVRPVSRSAAWLLAPYLLWVAYAVAINYAVMAMN